MEKKEHWQEPWCQVGFKTEDEWLNWWIQKLVREAENAEKELTKLCIFESEISQAEFKRAFNLQYFGCPLVTASSFSVGIWTRYINGFPRDTSSIEISFGSYIKPYYHISQLDRFLLEQGKNWIQTVQELSVSLENIVEQAFKIRRDILYPEVAEMERKLDVLSNKEFEERKKEMELQDRLLGKEVEIKRFQTLLAEKIRALDAQLQNRNILQNQLAVIHDTIALCINIERNNDDFRRFSLPENPKYVDSVTEKIWNIFVGKCELKAELAALKIEHTELEKQHSDRGVYLAEKEKEIEELKKKARDIGWGIFGWQERLMKSVFILNQSKKAFKSELVAEAKEIVEGVAERMLARIRTWSI